MQGEAKLGCWPGHRVTSLHVLLPPHLQTYWHTAIMRWVVVGMIGFLTGLVAFLLDFGMSALLRSKFSVFNQGVCVCACVGMCFDVYCTHITGQHPALHMHVYTYHSLQRK